MRIISNQKCCRSASGLLPRGLNFGRLWAQSHTTPWAHSCTSGAWLLLRAKPVGRELVWPHAPLCHWPSRFLPPLLRQYGPTCPMLAIDRQSSVRATTTWLGRLPALSDPPPPQSWQSLAPRRSLTSPPVSAGWPGQPALGPPPHLAEAEAEEALVAPQGGILQGKFSVTDTYACARNSSGTKIEKQRERSVPPVLFARGKTFPTTHHRTVRSRSSGP